MVSLFRRIFIFVALGSSLSDFGRTLGSKGPAGTLALVPALALPGVVPVQAFVVGVLSCAVKRRPHIFRMIEKHCEFSG